MNKLFVKEPGKNINSVSDTQKLAIDSTPVSSQYTNRLAIHTKKLGFGATIKLALYTIILALMRLGTYGVKGIFPGKTIKTLSNIKDLKERGHTITRFLVWIYTTRKLVYKKSYLLVDLNNKGF